MDQPTINPGARVYRRKRKFQGASWTPPSMSAEKPDGVYCKACRKRHGYKTLGFGVEKTSSGRWRILWSCPATGAVIDEKEL